MNSRNAVSNMFENIMEKQ